MRQRVRTRLERLERQVAPHDPHRQRIEEWAYGMANGNCLRDAILDMARCRTNRRALHEGREPLPRARDGRDDPRYRDMLMHELELLDTCWRAGDDFWQTLEAWCDEADRTGWPADPNPYEPSNHAGMRERLARGRRLRNNWREGEYAVRWHAEHPEWRPGMTEAELDAWELRRLGDE